MNRKELKMVSAETTMSPKTHEQSDRNDPRGFVMSIALLVFGVTVFAVLMMHFAMEYGWQVL